MPSPRRSPLALAPVVAVVLAVAAIAAACSPLQSVSLPDLGSLPAASVAAPSQPASADPAPSMEPDEDASPTMSTQDAVEVLANFRAWATSNPSYQVKFKGDSRHTTSILDLSGTIQASGKSADIRMTWNFPKEGKARSDYRVIDGVDWIRFDGGKWRKLASPMALQVFDPFGGVYKRGTMQWLGPVEGETDRFRFELDAVYLHPVMIPAANLTDEVLTKGTLDLVVKRDGTPVRGTWTMKGKGRVSGQLQAVEMDLDLTWSRIGDAISITKP